MKRSNQIPGRRKPVAAVFALISCCSLIFVGSARAQTPEEQALHDRARAEARVVLYTDLPVEVTQALVNGFKKRYSGVDVSFFRGDTGQVVQRFETESAAGRHEADVVTMTDRQSKQVLAKGFTQPYRSVHAGRYPAELLAPNDAWSTYSTVQLGIAWNTEKVKDAEVPKSYDEILDPKWRGRIGIQDPLQGGGAGIWVATMYGLWGETKWADYMRRLGAQRPRYARYLEVREMVASGEIAIQLVAYPAFTQPIIDKGAPVKWRLIDPALFTALTLNLSKNSPRPNAGRLYINFMLSDEGQQILADQRQIPALAAKMPKVYESVATTKLVPQAHELEASRFDFFQTRMKEYFVR